jgi:hypothetical protein
MNRNTSLSRPTKRLLSLMTSEVKPSSGLTSVSSRQARHRLLSVRWAGPYATRLLRLRRLCFFAASFFALAAAAALIVFEPWFLIRELVGACATIHSDGAPFFLFTPALTSQLSDVLWASHDFFGPLSGDIASGRGLPLSADADALYGGRTMATRVTPTLSPSPLSGPPSSDASEPFGGVGDEAGCLLKQPLSGPC